MISSKEKLASCAIAVPEILMPKKEIDHSKWAVIACDQFSSDKEYWKEVKNYVGDSPSTLNMILPECYLDESEKRVPRINSTMNAYLKEGILESAGTGFVYLNRSTPWVASRKGLIVALDLEEYSFESGVTCQIRPTEGTVLERLPIRAAIRENASLDIPHILVLFDDPDNLVFSLLESEQTAMKDLYDFDIPNNGGHLKGSLVNDEGTISRLSDIFLELQKKSDFLFAVGDGNHSLGAAKQLWEKIKANGGENIMNHPARWALVELENIHDDGLNFEPIHRVLFNVNTQEIEENLKSFSGFSLQPVSDKDKMVEMVEAFSGEGMHSVGMVQGNTFQVLKMEKPDATLASEAFHFFLDPWLSVHKEVEVDYIHGMEVLLELSASDENLGFYLPSIDKSVFFNLISKNGPMPRKTFSIGEAEEKRYYLESRKILPE